VNHQQVAHLFAQQTKPKGTGHNLFFEGATIYSYGRHFAIATFVKNKKGEKAVLFTREGYSHSTETHKSYVRRALSGVPVFYGNPVPRYAEATDKAELRKSFEQYIKDAAKAAGKAKKARKYGATYLDEALALLTQAAKFSEFFGLRLKAPSMESLVSGDAQKLIETRAAKATKDAQKARDKAQAAEAARQADKLEEWRTGANVNIYATDANGSAYLRTKGDEVQTSQGAQVPLGHAKRAFRFVKACKEQGQAWHRNGSQVRVGLFNLDEVTPEGNIHAGCHFITWERIAECAQAGGFFGDAASSEAVENEAA